MDKSAKTEIPHMWSKLFPGRCACILLWCGVSLSAGILMMWIHSRGWTRSCEYDLRRLLFSFLSTRGRTLKVNQRPRILTRMFGLLVTSKHSDRRVCSGAKLFKRNTL